MKKYLVVADTYDGGYGVEYHLFAICNTEEEAIQWVLNNPVVHFTRNEWGETREYAFSFFEYYDENKNNITKEEYIKGCYIREFIEDVPTLIGTYIE